MFWKYLSVLLVGTAAVGWLSFIVLFEWYSYNRPHTPHPEISQTFAINNHGSLAYLTKAEDALLTYLEFGAIGCFVAAFYLNRRFRFFPHPLEGVPRELRYWILRGKNGDPPSKLY